MSLTPSIRLFILSLLTLCIVIIALQAGSVKVSLSEIFSILHLSRDSHNQSDMATMVILDLRLPRIMVGLICGALLGLAGTLMQIQLRNPLADPYVLGISGGASIGALLAIWGNFPSGTIELCAFIGAAITMGIVFLLSGNDQSWTQTRLLLTGVMIAALSGAGVSLILAIAPEAKLKGMLFWLMGDLAGARGGWVPWVIMTALFLAFWPLSRSLNVATRGELEARALGVNIKNVRIALYFGAALATATAVTQGGSIGFIGLVAPHIARLLFGQDLRWLMPGAMLAGAVILTSADTAARTLTSPNELPVGVLTALLGAPFFLWLLRRNAR